MAKQEIKLIANNKKAHHDYFLEEKYEAGVELHGTEVKSLRMGKCSIKEAFVRIDVYKRQEYHNKDKPVNADFIAGGREGGYKSKTFVRPLWQ